MLRLRASVSGAMAERALALQMAVQKQSVAMKQQFKEHSAAIEQRFELQSAEARMEQLARGRAVRLEPAAACKVLFIAVAYFSVVSVAYHLLNGWGAEPPRRNPRGSRTTLDLPCEHDRNH